MTRDKKIKQGTATRGTTVRYVTDLEDITHYPKIGTVCYISLRFRQQMTKGRERGTIKKKKKDSTTATHPHWPVGPARGSILSRSGDIGNPLIVGQILPDLGDLFDPLRPGGILGAKIRMVHVGVQDHGNCGLVPCCSQENQLKSRPK
jgi:hypothetical protein